ncbi:MAG: M67 family metallopeptidase [Acidimicrobiia bacterium]
MTRPVVHLAEPLRREIIAHCIAGLPNEACGLLAVRGGEVARVYPTTNADASPTSYTIPPDEHYAALVDAESEGWSLGGVFHSHPSGPATLSQVDLDRALEPDWVYVVVGMEGDEPQLSVTRIG